MQEKFNSTTQALKALHWLPIRLRIEYKVLTLVFKCVHHLAPEYLCSMIKPQQITRPSLRSGWREHTLQVPQTKHKTFADRAFSVQGPRMWNNLPSELKSIADFNVFKRHLETYSFSKVLNMYYNMFWCVSVLVCCVFILCVKRSFDNLWLNWHSIS